jgi:PAS domain S-box-containing protein
MLDFEHRLLDALPDAVIVTTPPGDIVYWNDGAERIFGYRRAEAIGQRIDVLIEGPSPGDFRRHADEAMSTGSATFEAVRRRKDGTLLTVDASCRRLQPDGAADVFVLSCKRDVTELRARRDATWIDAKFGELLDATPDSLVIANASGRIVLANRQAEQLFGVEPNELCGQPVESLLAERCRSGELLQHAGEAPRSLGAEADLLAVRKDGREFPVEIKLRRLATEHGPMTVSALRDISERRRIEHALIEKSEALQGASASTERFLGTMSHELRTPLNAIIGFTGTLLMRLPGPLTADQERQLTTVQASARLLLRMIDELLELGRLESGQLDVACERVDLATVIGSLVATLRPRVEGEEPRLTCSVESGDWTVATDPRVLLQVLQTLSGHLLGLAGSGTVAVSLARRGAAARVTMTLKDSTIGAAALQPVCAALAPATALESSRQDAAGLSLYLAQKLAFALGGRIDCEPDASGGSVHLQLPER